MKHHSQSEALAYLAFFASVAGLFVALCHFS